MNKIEPQKVKESYEKSGWKPIQRKWSFKDSDGKICGVCAFSALVYDDPELLNIIISEIDHYTKSSTLAQKFELTKSYINGFINGFDCAIHDEKGVWKFDEYDEGYKDGRETWELVKNMI